MRRFIPILSVCALVFASNCVFDSEDKDDIKKGSVTGKITMIVTGEPVTGVKVMLASRNAKIDTVTYSNNRSAFVDSAITDSKGEYSITGIAPGDYGVFPVNEDTTRVFTFTLTGGTTSCEFASDGNMAAVNFTAEKTGYPGADATSDKDRIVDMVFYKNASPTKVDLYRRSWLVFVPLLSYELTFVGDDYYWNTGMKCTRSVYYPGFTTLAYTVDNCYFYVATYPDGTVRKFSIYHVLGTPADVTYKYTYDYSTDTLYEGIR